MNMRRLYIYFSDKSADGIIRRAQFLIGLSAFLGVFAGGSGLSTILFSAFLIWAVGRRENWTRWLSLFGCIISILALLVLPSSYFSRWQIGISLFNIGIGFYVCFLLFASPAEQLFKSYAWSKWIYLLVGSLLTCFYIYILNFVPTKSLKISQEQVHPMEKNSPASHTSSQQNAQTINPSNAQLLEEIRKVPFSDTDIWSGKIRAYESSESPRQNGIIIEGMIEKGDFERFVQVVRQIGPTFLNVYLFSPGGNAAEAMKIGSTIRLLKYSTNAMGGMSKALGRKEKDHYFLGEIQPQNQTCESACFLIFVGGANRVPLRLGIHRVYVDHDALHAVDGDTAIEESKTIKEEVSRYLTNMGTPTAIIEKMWATPSNEMTYLDMIHNGRELDPLKNEIEEVQEWLSAKCPPMDAEKAANYLWQSGFDKKKWPYPTANPQAPQIYIEMAQTGCHVDEMADLAKESWAKIFRTQ